MQLSIRQKIVARDDRSVFLLTGHDQAGGEIYCVLAVATEQLEPCLKAMDRDGFKPGDWGEVLSHGLGQPSEFQLNSLAKRHGLVTD